MSKVYTYEKTDWNGNVLQSSWYWYKGDVAKCCGATQSQKDTQKAQFNLFQTMTNQAEEVFGKASAVFNDIKSAFAPIVAAGPNQKGFSAGEESNLKSQAITQGGVAARNAMTAVKQANAAVGGGNLALPGGAEVGANVNVANAAAANTANQLGEINRQNYEVGRQNFNSAAGILSGSTNIFNPSTSANSAAVGGGSAAADTANQIAAASNSWVNAVTGLAGGIAGNLIPKIPTGGKVNKAPGGGTAQG